jgi:hypothetical protein
MAQPPLRGVSVLTLELRGLPALASGHYEGWALFANDRISTGKFNVAVNGGLTALNGSPVEAFPLTRDIVSAERIAVTIEPEGDREPGPSLTILEGPLTGGRAQLAFSVPVANLGGSVTLMTPSDNNPGNELSGAWFLEPGTLAGSLALPELPPGWVFEGWVGTQGLTFSMGRFTQASAPDMAAPYSGAQRPSAPGEDFIERLPATLAEPINLADGASSVAITIEPDLGGTDPTGAGPSSILVLHLRIPEGAPWGQALPLEFDPVVVPSGVASVG